ncbi:hypothetical protein FA95DRAFT_428932 [Auriscalpium vulgare]|uniref:Uncharacterized protein n=1 Tax=Auriscalpium vulgare TaxID=40419 RepID=A0ACB8RH37_9AGAM|nr:hypothetical protein FA95DRAFT_428932 [Auriscalpium vulgare]
MTDRMCSSARYAREVGAGRCRKRRRAQFHSCDLYDALCCHGAACSDSTGGWFMPETRTRNSTQALLHAESVTTKLPSLFGSAVPTRPRQRLQRTCCMLQAGKTCQMMQALRCRPTFKPTSSVWDGASIHFDADGLGGSEGCGGGVQVDCQTIWSASDLAASVFCSTRERSAGASLVRGTYNPNTKQLKHRVNHIPYSALYMPGCPGSKNRLSGRPDTSGAYRV